MSEDNLPPSIPPAIQPTERRQRPGARAPKNPPATPTPAVTPAPRPAAATPVPARPSNPAPVRRQTIIPKGAQRPTPAPEAASPAAAPPVIAPKRPARSAAAQPPVVQPRPSAQPAGPSYRGVPIAPQRPTNSVPAEPAAPATAPTAPIPGPPAKERHRRWPWVLVCVLVLLLAWPAYLVWDTNANLHHVDALVPGPDTPGTTYLLAGSDERPEGVQTDIEGARTDSILMIHVAPNGQTSMVSLPRDTYVEIPGYGWNKLNASFSFGGPQLLVETVQNMTGVTIDHYAQINMDGVSALVDAVGGVNLCMDFDAVDHHSGLDWKAGCHDADGETALAFARMRYEDPRGDLGRAQRQREVIAAVTGKVLTPSIIFNPFQQQRLARAGTETLTVDQTMNVFGIAKLMLAFRAASNSNLTGVPPLSSVSEMTNVGSVVLLDEAAAPEFFESMLAGTLTSADFDTTY